MILWRTEILPTNGSSYQILDINLNIFYIDKGEEMYKIIIILIILNMITYSEMFSSGREYLKKVINLKIEFFNVKGKNTCKYQIDKFNNLIYVIKGIFN